MTEGGDTGAIFVRKDVMDKFYVIMEETKLDANELMEHFFGLYNCCKKLVYPKTATPTTEQGLGDSGKLNHKAVMEQIQHQRQQQDYPESSMKEESQQTNNQFNTTSTTTTITDPKQTFTEANTADDEYLEDPDEKVNLLQKLREQAGNSCSSSNTLDGSPLLNYSLYSTPSAKSGGDSQKKRKKSHKKPKLCPSPVSASLVAEGEDLLKSSMCSLCQATFARFTDLLVHHKEVHNSDTNHPLRCRACGRTNTSEAGLIYHQVYVCKMVERPHGCHICGLKFQTEEMVLVHKCSGCPRKKYACEFCDHYRTESSSDLEKHMRIHTNDKCYVCKVCGFSTAWKKNLKEHMVKHLGLKPYSCDICGYSTSDRHNLRTHKMRHYQSGEACEKCGVNCRCNKLNVSVDKKRKLNENQNESSTSLSPSGGKELTCPYPQCVYRTKIEYMMTNHLMRHQGVDEYPSSHNTGSEDNSRNTNLVENGFTHRQNSQIFRINSSPAPTLSPNTSVQNRNLPSLNSQTTQLKWDPSQTSGSSLHGMMSPSAYPGYQGEGHAAVPASWASPLSPPVALTTNRNNNPPQMTTTHNLARPLPVFPNMPN